MSVNKEFESLKNIIGIKIYFKIFETMLTDNRSDFFDPLHIEIDYNIGREISKIFCKPYSSWQKGSIEKTTNTLEKFSQKEAHLII